ncbi:helix-turn-helix transcriptional regulator [Jiangella alba]|uniref:Predicted DNA-binding transcriptional regulator YafY, contains an HTH and WYL domains n=1 Tax=Jiangella alba TaxID=561176 RepID=A0A1H5P8K4_9ACTN|nr:WYL domain-containing protein [Jiangella alba]SEF10216.1 Predicted DNA-binding transcriptional regulator YafY, contains an HTH and WYL domains [Jiangella alba]
MGSQGQATAQHDTTDAPSRLPRMRRPAETPAAPRRGPGGARPSPADARLGEAGGRASRSTRLDSLARELHAAGRQGRTSSWLAERLGVSARTVKRDVIALQQSGVPIRASSGPQGGYVIDQSGQRALSLTPDEALAIVVGLQAVPDQPFAAAGASAAAKVLRAVAPDRRADVTAVAERIWIRPGEPEPDHDDAVRSVLADAIRDHRVVLLDHAAGPASASAATDDDAEALTEQVEPLGFAHSHGAWFVLVWSRESDAGRWFQLDHVSAAQPTHETFEPRDVREIFRPVPAAD